MSQGISVIVCCYNSSKIIGRCLEHLARQRRVPGYEYELVVVDNNCTDDTISVARANWEHLQNPFPLVLVEEKKPGLTYARKAGIQAAHYEYIIFCDDDNLLEEHYFERSVAILGGNEKIGALGGKGIVYVESELPDWWEEFAGDYAVGNQAAGSGNISERKFVWGAGMVSRKHLLKMVFDDRFPFILSDRSGIQLASGGDAEICARLLMMGFYLWYDDSLNFAHHIQPARLTVAYREEMIAGHITAYQYLRLYYAALEKMNQGSLFSKLKLSFKNVAKLLFSGFSNTEKNNLARIRLSETWGVDIKGAYGSQYEVARFRNFCSRINS